MQTLSKRAEKLLGKPSQIVKAAVQCYTDPFSSENPKGYLNFGVAENMLIDDILLEETSKSHFDLARYHHYHETFGCEELRAAFTEYLQKYFYQRNYDPNNVIVSAGASAILEILSFVLFNEGEKVVLPAPYYSGFETDLEVRFNAKIIPYPEDISSDFQKSPKAFIEYLKKEKPKAALICHPHNPTGVAYTKEYIQELCTFCEQEKIHLIFDEVYFMTRLEDIETATSLEFSEGSQYVHFVYSMAKDFALGGFKVGYFYSENQELINAFKAVAYFHTPSTHTQLLCASFFRNEEFISRITNRNKEKLNHAFKKLEEGILKKICPHYTKPTHCFFNMIDLSQVMQKLNITNEVKMFEYLMGELKINMLPGTFFGYPAKNYFRLCYARDDEQLNEFIKRFEKFI